MRAFLKRLRAWFRRLGRVFLRRGFMRVRAYPVLSEAVERGVAYGWAHARKHTRRPTPESVQAEIHQAVLDEVCQAFDFPDDDLS